MKLPAFTPPLFHIGDEDRELARDILATVYAAVVAHGLPKVRKKWHEMIAEIGPVDVLGRPSYIFLISDQFGLELRVRSLEHQNGAEFVLRHTYEVPECRGPKFFEVVMPRAIDLWREVFDTVPTHDGRRKAEEVRRQLEALVCGAVAAAGTSWDSAYLEFDRRGEFEIEVWRAVRLHPQAVVGTTSSKRIRGMSEQLTSAIREAACLADIHATYFPCRTADGRVKIKLGPPPSIKIENGGVLEQMRTLAYLPERARLLLA